MYPNLSAELARNRITIKKMSEILEMNYDTLKNKMSGSTDFKRKEMYLIKKEIFPYKSIDYLFEELNEKKVS